jgi:hypothetical protein
MGRHIRVYMLLMLVGCTFCEGQNKTGASKNGSNSQTINQVVVDSIEGTATGNDWSKRLRIMDYKLPGTYNEIASQGIIIQNSFPKGDRHTDSRGRAYGIAIFWTRVINESASPLELTINFAADSIASLSSPDSYLKVFLPSDTMTRDKVILYNYGVTGLRYFLDNSLNKPTTLQRTINPKEECFFYVGVLRYDVLDEAQGPRQPGLRRAGGGVIRTGLDLKEQNLFYRISIDHESALIPCGQIVFKD